MLKVVAAIAILLKLTVGLRNPSYFHTAGQQNHTGRAELARQPPGFGAALEEKSNISIGDQANQVWILVTSIFTICVSITAPSIQNTPTVTVAFEFQFRTRFVAVALIAAISAVINAIAYGGRGLKH
ncbi:hypothetical protein B566_EDAN012699 [Ephemera danica]|nr:hypothetical protein B566_EDAN012699 [Ephemera danica]